MKQTPFRKEWRLSFGQVMMDSAFEEVASNSPESRMVKDMRDVTVHRGNTENRFYAHELFCIKEEAAPLITGAHDEGRSGGATSAVSILKRIRNVKMRISNGEPITARDE